MADFKILGKLVIDDKGQLGILGKKAKGAAKEVDRVGTSAHTADRRLKGTAQASSNTTKNFSKMAQGITGSLVPAYATLAANIFAIGAAFRFLQDAANYRILIEGQREYATVTGESLKLLTSRLQEATGQQLAFAEAAQAAAIGRAAGLSSDQISRLGAVAKNASIALGRDLTDSFNRLVRGSTKAEPELLDELGIILRLETATERYGNAIGKTKDELSTFERSQAVTNEVLRQGEEKFQEFNTELNNFTKLAKSFDDLINSLKKGLTGVAEFFAGALSQNVTALAGAFALLGTGIARAIVPMSQPMDFGAARAGALEKLQGFYSGKRDLANMGAKGFKSFERDMMSAFDKAGAGTGGKSVFDTEKMTREEALKTTRILKATMLERELSQAKGLDKLALHVKLTYATYRQEHSRTMSFVKTTAAIAGQALNKALAFVGYAGVLLSLIGVVQQLIDKFRDPALVKYEEAQKRVLGVLKEQNEELTGLHDNLKQSIGFFDSIIQQAAFLSNFSFKGISDAFKSFETQSKLENEAKERKATRGGGQFSGFGFQVKQIQEEVAIAAGTSQRTISLTGNQRAIIEQSISSMQLMQTQLDTNSESYTDLSDRITKFTGILQKEELNEEEYIKLGKAILDLENNTTKAQESFNKFANANRILKDSVVEYGKALASLRPKTGTMGILLKQVEIMEEGFNDLLNSDLKELTEASAKELMSAAQESALKTMIGAEAFNKAIEDAKGSHVEKLTLLQKALQDRRDELERAAYADVLDRQGIGLLSQAAQIGATPLQVKTIQNQEKQLQLQREITAAQEIKNTLQLAGTEMDKVAFAQNEQNLLNLQFQLELLKLQKDEMYLIGQAARGAFEGGMTSAIDDLITGKESSLKDAMAKMAKGVFEGVSKQISSRMSESLTNALFGNREMEAYKQGAMIIKQAHIDGIQQGLGTVSPMSSVTSQTGQDQGFFGKAMGFLGTFGSFFGFKKGGITPVYAAAGGTFKGPKSGYPAMLHGNEAVVPLPDGRSIPVSGGMGGNVNVSVNMTTGETSTTSNDAEQMNAIGQSIAQAVQNELERQQRPGGMLAPY